jgi:nicotinamidase/pyrazinamidase
MTMALDPATDCLGLIDVQPTFMPGGGLAVAGGDEVAALINRISPLFSLSFATQDWHPEGHSSFASAHAGRHPYDTIEMPYGPQTLWPDHGIAGTPEAELHPDLVTTGLDLILRKGTNPGIDSYSAFRENDRVTVTGLAGWLTARGVKRLFLVGIATDFCVGWSAIDAAEAGFETYVIEDATRPVAVPLGDGRTTLDLARAEMLAAGVRIIASADLLAP